MPHPLAVEAERSIRLLQQRTAENILVPTAELGIPVAAVPVPAALPIPRKRAVVSK